MCVCVCVCVCVWVTVGQQFLINCVVCPTTLVKYVMISGQIGHYAN